MIQTLKRNKALLKRRRIFDQSRFKEPGEYLKAPNKPLKFKSATPALIAEIREKILTRNKRLRAYRLLMFAVIFVLLTISITLLFQYINDSNAVSAKMLHDKNAELVQLEKDKKRYEFFMSDAEIWLQKGHLKNAAFQYNKALELFPGKDEPLYGLALVYSMTCQMEGKNCESGQKLVAELLTKHPNHPDLLQLKAIGFEKGI